MGKWITGDLHVHNHNCADGTLPVMEIIERSRQYCDFIGISGHSYDIPNWGRNQYNEILEARKRYPDMPIFHTAEQNFPVERHTMFLTVPENNEFPLQQELIRRFHRQNGNEGLEKGIEALHYVKDNWGEDQTFMIFNHPNAPAVSLEDLEGLAASCDVFKVIACVDRRERRAPQLWDIGAEWDQLLMKGYRLFARNGSDFHEHFTDGGTDYLPGEFVQDHLWVENNTYTDIIEAYRTGRFYCTVGNCIRNPLFSAVPCDGSDTAFKVSLSFEALSDLAQVDIITDGKAVLSFTDISGHFTFEDTLEGHGYFRVRGLGKPSPRKYSEGEYEPLFLLNPIFP